MKKSVVIKLIIFSFSLGVLFSFQNCSDVSLEGMKAKEMASSTKAQYCTQDSEQVRSRVKFIFVLDRSLSNRLRFNSNPQLPDLPGTDAYNLRVNPPILSRRFEPLINFINQPTIQNRGDHYFSYVKFNTDSEIVRISSSAGNFTNIKTANGSSPSFLRLIQNEYNSPSFDDGGTNYVSAITDVYTLINEDIQAAKEAPEIISSSYIIFFVSDGFPRVLNGAGLPVEQTPEQVLPQVRRVAGLKQANPGLVDSIQFNTGFYFSDEDPNDTLPAVPDPRAQDLLRQMALEGSGVFRLFGEGQAINFSDYQIPIRNKKFEIKEIWVTNLNTIWENGRLVLDSDGDYLSDAKELSLGSNPNNPDTDGNGARDGVESRTSPTGSPCKNADCSRTNSTIVLCGEPPPGGFLDRDNDDLNDCEESLLGSDPFSFDSNGDYVPDGFAFSKGLEFLRGSGVTELINNRDFDMVNGRDFNNYSELKANTPMSFPNDQIPNLRYMRIELLPVSSDFSRSCYSISVRELAAIGQNQIRIYVIENTSLVNETKIIRKATRTFNGSSISFSEGDFR